MGSVHKTKRSRFWLGSFWHEGKQTFRSTGQTEKAQALQVVLAWEAAVKGPMENVEQARRVMADLLGKVVGDAKVRISCREYVERYLDGQRGTVAADTLEFYRSTLRSWLDWLGPRAERPLDLITREDMVAFRTDEGKRVTATTANHRVKALRQLFKAALSDAGISVNPAEGLRSLRKERKAVKVRRPFTMSELRQLTAVMDDEWQLITWLGLYTGQRLGDVLSLRRDEIDAPGNAVKLVTGKVGLKLWIPIPAHLTKRLMAWWKNNGAGDFVFQRWVEAMAKRASGKTGKASDRFAHWLWLAGLRSQSPFVAGRKSRRRRTEDALAGTDGNDRRVQHELSFHCLRHTSRTLLEEAGQPKAVIDAFIGHEGETGRIYTTVGEAALRQAAEALAKAAGK